MSYGIITTDTLADIADAIRAKNGLSTAYLPSEMPAAISAIETGSSSDTTTAVSSITEGVQFIDLTGNVLYAYSWDEVAELTELPALVDITVGTEYGLEIPMTCTGWNWSLESIQNYASTGGLVTVGAVYIPTDEKTHFIVHLCQNATLSLYLTASVADNAVLIDWGDDNSEYTTSTSATVYSHTYENDEEFYDITIEEADGTCGLYGSSTYGALYQSTIISSITYNKLKTAIKLIGLYIGNSVTSISSYAFSSCYSLTSVSISDSVTSIGDRAFYNCYSLTSVSISDSVTSISSYVFFNCYSLTSVSISDSVTSIRDRVFYSCYSLTSVSISDSVTSIGDRAFYNCYSLTSVSISDSVTSIGDYSFYGCYSLCSIDGLYINEIVSNAFTYDSSLVTLTNVRYIGADVDFVYSPLSRDSCLNLFNALDEDSTGTLTISSDSYALLSDDDIAIATDKGWAVAVS